MKSVFCMLHLLIQQQELTNKVGQKLIFTVVLRVGLQDKFMHFYSLLYLASCVYAFGVYVSMIAMMESSSSTKSIYTHIVYQHRK